MQRRGRTGSGMGRAAGFLVVGMLLVGLVEAPLASAGSSSGGESRSREGATSSDTGFSSRPYVVTPVRTREERTAIVRTGASIAEVRPDAVVVLATRDVRDEIRSRGYETEPVATSRTSSAEASDFPAHDSRYHNYWEMVQEIRRVERARPGRVDLFSIGRSHQGRRLWGARVGNGPEDDQTEPGVLFVASHHGREHLSVEVALGVFEFFALSNRRVVSALRKNRQIYFVFNLNPDGSQYDIAGHRYRYWRKNRQPHPKREAIGTDLNRNYAYRWGCCGGSSWKPWSETYRGWRRFSAPETSALRDFIRSHKNIRTAISYHSYGSVILFPYGYTYEDVPPDMTRRDRRIFVRMGRRMGRRAGYRSQQSSDAYITDGDFIDWAYGTRGIYAFTVELGGGSFYPGDEIIPSEVRKNRRAAVYLALVARCPGEAIGDPCR